MPAETHFFPDSLKQTLRGSLVAALMAVLSACGGGGSGGGSGSSGDDNQPPIVPAPAVLVLSGDTSAEVGDSVGVVASVSERGYNRFRWEQLSGPALGNLAGNGTAGISFNAPYSGTYSFRLTASSPTGGDLVDTFDINVDAGNSGSRVQLRADRAVTEGADISLRLGAKLVSGDIISWRFEQISGPRATLNEDDSGQRVIFVTAPKVTGDQVLTFRGTLETTAGSFSDVAYVVVQDRPEVTSEYFCDGTGDYCATSSPLNPVYSYRADSPYGDRLAACVYSNQLGDDNFCTLGQLPVIGMENSAPSVDLIMDHVLVSHDWMGARFERFLKELDPYGDFANLLRATTAIVISSDIRPSFYWSLTGAIYLDPESLWLTPEERDVINEQPDYRSGFGSELRFVTPWRYIKNNNYAFTSYYPADRNSRPFSDLEADLGSLLYHELAHANDAMSQAKINRGLDRQDIFFNQAQSGSVVNKSVSAVNGLQSEQLFALAEVRYRGEPATLEQRTYSPQDVAGFFFPDTATDFYAYVTPWEDTAMLFEETMMSLRFGIERDVAVTNSPTNPTSADDFVVYQGQRGRIGAGRIRARASTAVQWLLPEAWASADAHLQSLIPVALCSGEGWGQNLNPACEGQSGLLRFAAPQPSGAIPMPTELPRSFLPPTRF
ncbi:hypothetical protein GNX18_09715 [Microbulbifer sp. SH-1]|uniref:hypothetical protein n=1 Tax=Microbulbifer sp. SH-1 TaxID=2681547 RepID=UPI00140E436A|nr:hypothetical protein [Microbulbifer sp. SH-1]QIL89999.1 hypothetical protein GNX18_09715 [Microbulbifer sp. SH-1]